MTSFITGQPTAPQSLGVQIGVTAGVSQTQRKVGNYSALYFADGANIQDVRLELDQFNVWASNPQETYQRLVVSCTGVLQFTGTKPDNTTIELPVNRLLVIDSELRNFTLTNVGEGRVRANLNFVSNRQSDPPFVPMPT